MKLWASLKGEFEVYQKSLWAFLKAHIFEQKLLFFMIKLLIAHVFK